MKRRSFIRLVAMAATALVSAPAIAPAADLKPTPLTGKPLTDIYPHGIWIYGDGTGELQLLGCATGVSAMQEQMLARTRMANEFAKDEWLRLHAELGSKSNAFRKS